MKKGDDMRNLKMGLVAVASALLVSLTACGGSSSGDDGSGANSQRKVPDSALIEPGVLTISTNATQPPMQFVDGGKVAGMRIELGTKIAEELGLKPKFVNIDFAAQIPGLSSGRWDMIDTGMYYSEERAQQLSMVPYEVSAIAVSVGKDNPKKIASIDDLAGTRIAAEQGATEYKTLESISNELVAKGLDRIDVAGFNDTASSYQALAAGQVDGVAAVQAVVQYYSKQGQFATAITDISPVAVALGFAKGNTVLANAVSTTLTELKASGWLDDLFHEYGLRAYPGDMKITTGPVNVAAE